MNTQRNMPMVSWVKFQMTFQLCRLFSASAILALFLVLSAPGAWAAEEYWSGNWSYQADFNGKNDEHNDLSYMDTTYFAGNKLLLFTLLSTHSSTYTSQLYWQAPGCPTGSCYGAVPIGNTSNLNFRIKTAVFNNRLYIFYSPSQPSGSYSLNRIYYRTAEVDRGTEGNEWKLVFSDEKSIPTVGIFGSWISFAAVMNGKIYIIYTSGVDWYYITSQDGAHFDPPTYFLSTNNETPNGPSGTVFHVPDPAEGWKERLMVSYCPGGASIRYFFFDGHSAYGLKSVETPGLYPTSVRLWTGTAKGYTNDKYAIQAFIASPQDGTNMTWSSIHHREFIPSGPNGDQGFWRLTWSLLGNSRDDTIRCRQTNISDPGWGILPDFVDPYASGNTDTVLYLYTSKGSTHAWKISGGYHTVMLRSIGYNSDRLMHDASDAANQTVPASSQDLTTSTVLGVIEGTPPFPENGGIPNAIGANTSTVELANSTTNTYTTTWSAGGSVALSFGVEIPSKFSFQGKFSGGLKRTVETGKSYTTSTTFSLQSFTNNTSIPKKNPGDWGWVLALKPEIITSQYVVKGYDGSDLSYDGVRNEMRLTLIQFGKGSFLANFSYYLQNPSAPIEGDPPDPYPAVFEGMAARPLSTDIAAWSQITHIDPSYHELAELLPWTGTQGQTSTVQTTVTVSDAKTWSFNAGYTASSKKLGMLNFGTEYSINFTLDLKTSTVMASSAGFKYNMPACVDGKCCVGYMDIIPYIFEANEDDTGYNAPWISNDIRNYKKPKPWAISYKIYPSQPCPSASLSSGTPKRLTVREVEGFVFHDRTDQYRDRVSAKLALEGIAPDFSLNGEGLVHLRLGTYTSNSGRDYVVSRDYQGNTLVLKLKETADSRSSITLKLSYDNRRSLLNIDLDADRIDLQHLFYTYGLATVGEISGNQDKTVPFSFFLGDKYNAEGELKVHCAINDQNALCNLKSSK